MKIIYICSWSNLRKRGYRPFAHALTYRHSVCRISKPEQPVQTLPSRSAKPKITWAKTNLTKRIDSCFFFPFSTWFHCSSLLIQVRMMQTELNVEEVLRDRANKVRIIFLHEHLPWFFYFLFINFMFYFNRYTVFTKINAHPEISAHQEQWFFKGGSTQNRWVLMGDFSKGGVHKTDGFWWVIFQRGEYTKPMGCDGWLFKGGVHKTDGLWMGDFSKGGVHKTDGLWMGDFSKGGGEYTKPMGFGILFYCF